jgi:copper chaperone CopZ
VKKIHLLIFLSLTLLFQSCFEIIEQVQLNNDGSGNFQLTLNLSQSKTKLNSIMKLTNVNGHPVPTKQNILDKLNEIKTTLEQTPGITAVKVNADLDNYIGTVSYNFSSVAQLNKSIRNVEVKEKAKPDQLGDYYSYDASTKVFERKNQIDFKKIYAGMSNADKQIFADAMYTSIFKFQSDIAATANRDTKVSPNKKAIMLKATALDIITEKKSIVNKINLN